MKTSKIFKLIIPFMLVMFALCSCQQKAPDLDEHEQDIRLLGVWTMEKDPSQRLEFRCNGILIGLNLRGGKRLFYTERDSHLVIFVYGSGIKLSNQVHSFHYKVEGDKLYLWWSKEDMLTDTLTNKLEKAQIYTKSR